MDRIKFKEIPVYKMKLDDSSMSYDLTSDMIYLDSRDQKNELVKHKDTKMKPIEYMNSGAIVDNDKSHPKKRGYYVQEN